MKKSISIVKVQLIVLLTFFSGLLSVHSQPQLQFFGTAVPFFSPKNNSPQFTNALSCTPSTVLQQILSSEGTIGWESVTVYTVVIPFDSNSLNGNLEFKTNQRFYYPSGYGYPAGNFPCIINVDGNVTPPNGATTYSLNNLSIGSHNYTVKSIAIPQSGISNLLPRTSSLTKIRVVVEREPTPVFNLSLSTYCQAYPNNHPSSGLFNGQTCFVLSGTRQNINNQFTAVLFNSSNVVLNETSMNYTDSSYHFFCSNAITTYTLKMKRAVKNMYNNQISSSILNSGSLGWNNLSYTKTLVSCMNFLPQEDPKLSFKHSSTNEPKSNPKIYPNPIEDKLNINLDKKDNLISIRIFDQSQSLLIQKSFTSKSPNAEIDVTNLKKGLYFVEIKSDKETLTEKIVKQ